MTINQIYKSEKCFNYDEICSKTHPFQILFFYSQLQKLTTSRQKEVKKSYINKKGPIMHFLK